MNKVPQFECYQCGKFFDCCQRSAEEEFPICDDCWQENLRPSRVPLIPHPYCQTAKTFIWYFCLGMLVGFLVTILMGCSGSSFTSESDHQGLPLPTTNPAGGSLSLPPSTNSGGSLVIPKITTGGDNSTGSGGSMASGGTPACQELWFEDLDGDGFGSPERAACERVSVFWVQQGGDCNDADPDVYPDASASHQSHGPFESYDYNCDGKEELDGTLFLYEPCKAAAGRSCTGGGTKPGRVRGEGTNPYCGQRPVECVYSASVQGGCIEKAGPPHACK